MHKQRGIILWQVWLFVVVVATCLVHCGCHNAGAPVRDKDTAVILAYYQRGNDSLDAGQLAVADENFRKGLALSQQDGNKLGEASGYANRTTYYGLTGQFDSMVAAGNKAIALFRQEDYRKGPYLGTRMNLLAEYLRKGEYAPMVQDGLDILKEAKAVNDTPYIARALSMLGTATVNLNDYDKAIAYQKEGVALLRQAKDKQNLHSALSELAMSLGEAKRYKEELQACREALQHQEQDLNEDAYTLDYLADAHLGLGDNDSALYYLKKAEAMTRQIGDPLNLLNIYSSYADLYQKTGYYTYALQAIDSGDAIMQRNDISILKPTFILLRASVLAKMGDYAPAMAAQRLGDSLKEVASGEVATKQIAELETKYKTKEQQASIRVLSRTNVLQRNWLIAVLGLLGVAVILGIVALVQYRKQRRANAVTQRQAERLQWLMKEIHHRVKNNLQVITSLISMQLRRDSKLPAERVLRDTMMRIQSITIIHQKLYQHNEKESVNMTEYSEQLAHAVLAVHGVATVHVDSDVWLDVDTAVMLGLVLAELITNSCKHARVEGKGLELAISITIENEGYRLRYCDNGPGLPEEMGKGTMGMQIIALMTRQMGGVIEWTRKGGVCCTIHFKDEAQRKAMA